MQVLRHLKNQPSVMVRVTSLTWAVLLVAPLFVLAAAHTKNRFYFHSFLFLAGWLCWTYTEYFFHRFIMHAAVCKKGLSKFFNHTHHHKDPADIRVSKLHRVLLIAGSCMLFLLSYWLDDCFTILCGYLVGITVYSFMHVILHHRWSLRIFPRLHRFHLYHHCRHADKCFGVTFTWWDHLFGTVPLKHPLISDRIRIFYYKTDPDCKPLRQGKCPYEPCRCQSLRQGLCPHEPCT